eukprot:2710865-Pleurochrysis_carterae.AAC.1
MSRAVCYVRSVAARAVDVISLDLVRNLCDSEDFSRLAQLVGAVFGSPALFNASFAPAGKLQSQARSHAQLNTHRYGKKGQRATAGVFNS